MFANAGMMTPLYIFFGLLGIAAFAAEAWAFIDAVRRPAGAFVAAGKQTKPLWLIILGVAAVVGLGTAAIAVSAGGGLALIGILPVAAFVAAAIYLTDVRPKVKGISGGGSGTRMGPYGPW